MIGSAALFLVAMSGAGQLRTVQPLPATLTLQGEAATPSAWSMDVSLRVTRYGLDGGLLRRNRWLAQSATRATDATPATPAAASAAASTEAPAASTCETCDIDCETCRESDRQARYVMRRRSSLLRTHRAFGIAAWSSLLVTEALGTILAINRPTWFGDGACATDPSAFGCGSGTMGALHLASSFLTTGLYATAGILAIAAPDPDNASVGDDRASSTLRLHKTLAWVHGAGMILMPILGILGSRVSDPEVGRAFRTVHTGVGYATFAALSWAMYLELF
ncbi:MAG: hypothetical protein EPO40_26375 [Myxococcaceae bacterium]|nr:MAG: hypothetical protein EPO40_26375 [Myxococcaceae bacterium]